MNINNPLFLGQLSTKTGINPGKYTAEISRSDLAVITQKYKDQVQDIYDLAPGQKWMFHKKSNNRSAFFLQMLLKTEMKLKPIDFRRRVNEVCKNNETLRFAYVYRGLKKPYCVCLKDRSAEISFENLSEVDEKDVDPMLEKYCDADIRRGFDLEKDPLLRIHIYKLKKEDNYAIMISQPHINSDGTSIGILIKDLFIDYVLNIDQKSLAGGRSGYKSIAVSQNSADINKELDYWKKYLSGLTEDITLPGMQKSSGEFNETVYIHSFPPALSESLKAASKKYKTTTYNIMQAAWGIMLNRITGRQDIVFGAITSGRDARVFQSLSIPGGFVKVIPVRLRISDDMMFGNVVKALQKDFAWSMENSHCSVDQISEAIGRRNDLFNHVLNCHNFEGNQSFSKDGGGLPGFKIVGASVYDNLSEDLAVYIRTEGDRVILGMGYNASVFSRETIQLYAESFSEVLQQILFRDNDTAIGDIGRIDVSTFEYMARLHQCEELKKTMLLKKHPVFECAKWDDLMSTVHNARINTLLAADILYNEKEVVNELHILIEGTAVVKAATNGGWMNPLKVCGPGALIGMSGLFKGKRSSFKVVINSDKATVLSIPFSDLKVLMEKYPSIWEAITEQIYAEGTKFLKLWLNT